jgi:hypothetical protein
MIAKGLIRGPGIRSPKVYREPQRAVVIGDGITKKPRPVIKRKPPAPQPR